MRAYQVTTPGGADALQLRELPDPQPEPGWVVIRVRAFGINRSELYTRRGESGDAVTFPRVLGIECVGEVVAAPGSDLQPGQRVAAAMGNMGRQYDGGYAEMTKVPRSQVMPFDSDLAWDVLGALPETYYTAWTSLFDEIDLKREQTLFIRGGTSSVGMAATRIAKHLGCTVIATTRKEAKRAALVAAGVDHVIIDAGEGLAAQVRALCPDGVHGALELVGLPTTLSDTATVIREGGRLCQTGLLGDTWGQPLPEMPAGVTYSFGNTEKVETVKWTPITQTIVDRAKQGAYDPNIFEVFPFEQLQQAHECMENNRATGKLVVVT
ncbi:MAG: zinc-binding dehydrogenase [Myxococcota bacterium]